jgi:hypothetical protein
VNEPPADADARLDALFALARKHRPETSASEFAFETRLLACLRARREAGSVWAVASWRLIPFCAACLTALVLWHAEVLTETTEAEQTAYVENPEPIDAGELSTDL